MKPMGTITKYYPFIDEETKSILKSLMDESSSYYDFVTRLAKAVLENEVPDNLAYIAAVQAWWCRIEDTIGFIQERYKKTPQITPWGFAHTSLERDQIRFHDAVVESIEKLSEKSPGDWILTELHLLHAHFHWPLFSDIPSQLKPVEKARELISANPLLECFEAQACFYEGWAKRIEGEIEGALEVYERGQELAETYDESLHRYLNLGGQGDALKTVDIQKAIERYEEAYVLVQDLEVPYLESEVLYDSGLVFLTAGEYDLAISSLNEAGRVVGDEDCGIEVLPGVYVTLGDGQRALDMMNCYIKDSGNLETPLTYSIKASALALLNRLEEAESNLAEAQKHTMKSGLDHVLARYYNAAGRVELAKGNYLASQDFFEQSLEIFERVGDVSGEKNTSLIGLARSEILQEGQSTNTKKSITMGRWLSNLEKYATKRDLPGIRMEAALLKSEFYQNHGQIKDAQATLQDALSITKSKGVATLRKRISDRIQELERLFQDELPL